MTKEDIGIYYCGSVFLNLIQFISGANLMLKGTESKDFNVACGEIPVENETTFKNNESNNQKVWDPVLLCLISSNVVFVIVIVTLVVVHCKRWGNRHQASTNLASLSREVEDSEVNYAAVSFASVPPARRSNNRHRDLAEYSKVNYNR
ncbi:hypothetical protein R3I94_000964 [Phoxinus phoxinus]